ncbi:MAG: YciI family protein [Solirubrobacteraceae bacterium]
MKYAMLIHIKPGYFESMAEEEQKAISAEYMALAEDPRARGGAQLQGIETATTVRVRDGQTLTANGPYADATEVFAGYYVFEAENLDQAIELAARIPAARQDGAIEVRPLAER